MANMYALSLVRGFLLLMLTCAPKAVAQTSESLEWAELEDAPHQKTKSIIHECDVVIAGGSLASAAAAVASGQTASNSTRVCFLEITDWPGGQATAGGISAMDFGLQYLNFPQNIPKSLGELLTAGKMGAADYNPGECQYLPKCFPPQWVAQLLLDQLAALPNVKVFLNTTVVKVDRDTSSSDGRVIALHAIQRTPTAAHSSGWDRPLSKALPDWYSPKPSAYFDKTLLQFVVSPTGVVVEGTEFGDVLVLADGVAVGQGVELGTENSSNYDQYCGNPAAFSVMAEWGTSPLPPNTNTSSLHAGHNRSVSRNPLPQGLAVRRYWTMANHTPRSFNPYHDDGEYIPPVAPGDHYVVTSNCNDLKNANVFLPLNIAKETARAGTWGGGINLTAVAMAETQTWGCFHDIQNGVLSARPDESGTSNGFSKMLYLRESRRSRTGLDGFRLCHNIMSASDPGPGGLGCSTSADPPTGHSQNGTGYRFFDTVAIGSPQPKFGYDVHIPKWCALPPYISDKLRIPNSSLPFYIPFRALTVANASNILVAGKSMATSFFTNSVTRLHPNEWASGTAAGVAAVMMSALNLTAGQMVANVSRLQDRLRSVGVPLNFNFTL
eukprot:m.346114 g.346114  ORF g.346114 m.346114 type:complete len:609 (+) comp28152_c0_seq1:154-1980(+)